MYAPCTFHPLVLGTRAVRGVGFGAELPAFPIVWTPQLWAHSASWLWAQGATTCPGPVHPVSLVSESWPHPAETHLGLLTLPAISISCCIWAILDRSWINFTKMLLTCSLTCTKIKPKGGIDLISLSVGALRALMGFNYPK